METLILHQNLKRWEHLKTHSLLDISDLVNRSNSSKEELLDSISGRDVKPNRIALEINEMYPIKTFSAICIDSESLSIDLSILLACHIRLESQKGSHSETPIIIAINNFGNLYLDKKLIDLTYIQNFQHTKGFDFLELSNFIDIEEDEEGEFRFKFEIFLSEKYGNSKILLKDLKGFKVTADTTANDLHSIANQWGAVRLAQNVGYSEHEIEYHFPQTLYFKFLKSKYKEQTATDKNREEFLNEIYGSQSLNRIIEWTSAPPLNDLIDLHGRVNLNKLLKRNKILLIDDNADKGWKEVLELIFKCEITVLESQFDFVENAEHMNFNEFDLFFVDLYLPSRKGDNQLDKENTFEIISILRKNLPHIPLIVFTASNKSWTLTEVLERGADGMYVKESPEYAGDADYSRENIKLFLAVVIESLIKYRVLAPYWKEINSLFTLDLDEKEHKNNGIQKKTKFTERKNERLKMFYGLLKRGFEERTFNEQMFHFSDYELAFLTLWSLLNEISEANYDKEDKGNTFELVDGNGKIHQCSPIRNNRESNWKLRGTDKYLIEHKYGFENLDEFGKPALLNNSVPKLKSMSFKIGIERTSNSFDLAVDKSPNRSNVINEIAPQVAFIMLCKQQIPEDKVKVYCSNLYRLNKVRNQLYLTHGEYVNSGFYSFTEQEKRNREDYNLSPAEDIKDLFELVAFLISGEEVTVNLAN